MTKLARLAGKTVFAAADLVLPRLQGPRILIYHQVGTDLGREMEVTEASFIAHLDWLAKRGRIVDLETALAARHSHGADRLFVLTFDDGYRDLFDVAWRHLLERKLPFMLYLTTRPVETQQPLSHDLAPPLNWDQIEEMLSSGLMTLGAHTHNHPDLRRLQSSEVESELETCNKIIERRTSLWPRHFAYPWGYWSKAADALTRTRYKTAALGGPIEADPFGDDHLVSRLPVQRSDGLVFFQARMHNGLRLEERFRRRLRGYVRS
jgi:peptidoglycan/xylan/chitin deacetylase (PgdA/CDA1 family)